jgi:hypothetical protein
VTKFTGKVLALDLATTTGWAFGRPGTKPKFGTVRFAKPGAARAKVYSAFREWLFLRIGQPDLIVFESAASPMVMQGRTNIDTIKLLIGLTEHLEEWCHERVELREASVQQIRPHFIGENMKSKLAKAATIERCHELGWMVTNDNEADACALWSYQVCCLRPDIAIRMTPLFATHHILRQ